MRNMPSDGQAVQCLRACSGEARLKIIMKCELPGACVAVLDESHRKELRNGSGLGLSRNEGNLGVSNEGWCEWKSGRRHHVCREAHRRSTSVMREEKLAVVGWFNAPLT